MIRVLHLCDRASDYQTATAIDALCRDTSGEIAPRVREIGRGGAYSHPIGAAIALRRARERNFDLIHAWGLDALRAAAFGAASAIVYTPTVDPHHREIRWLRSIMDHRQVQVVCATDTLRRRLVERGVPMERAHLIRPGVSFGKISRKRNDALRAALGLTPQERVTLAVGESTREAAHEDAVFAVTLLHVMDQRSRVITWGRGPDAEVVARFSRKIEQGSHIDAQRRLGRLISFHEFLSIADEALITAAGPIATQPICETMAAGLPIVSTVTPTVAELLEDRHSALFVTKRSPQLIAQRLLDLRENASLLWSITDMARTEAFEFFSLSRFLEQHRSVYQQTNAGGEVQIAQPPPGAGMRFHGRA